MSNGHPVGPVSVLGRVAGCNVPGYKTRGYPTALSPAVKRGHSR
jgi:hypothetical protein